MSLYVYLHVDAMQAVGFLFSSCEVGVTGYDERWTYSTAFSMATFDEKEVALPAKACEVNQPRPTPSLCTNATRHGCAISGRGVAAAASWISVG